MCPGKRAITLYRNAVQRYRCAARRHFGCCWRIPADPAGFRYADRKIRQEGCGQVTKRGTNSSPPGRADLEKLIRPTCGRSQHSLTD